MLLAKRTHSNETRSPRDAWTVRGCFFEQSWQAERVVGAVVVGLYPTTMQTTQHDPGLGLQPPKPRPKWRVVVREALERLGGEASLQALYFEIDREYHASSRWHHWKAKVRQVVQLTSGFERVGRGIWRLRSPGTSAPRNESAK